MSAPAPDPAVPTSPALSPSTDHVASDTPPPPDLVHHTVRKRNPIGGHVRVAGGLARTGLANARDVGAETVQVFVANPRGWATPAGDPRQDEEFRERCAVNAMTPYIHAPYLINPGSHTPATAERSVISLQHSLRRGREIGARGVVVHTGAATGGRDRATALAQVRELLLPLLDALDRDTDPALLLEPTAGQGASLCSLAEDLGPYFDALDHHPRLGVCLDTCHVFAAGQDLAAPGGATTLLDRLTETVGSGRLQLIHANDSQDVCGARKDRHANIGQGHIGTRPFADLFLDARTTGVPWVIETPGGPAGHAADIALLKSLRAAAAGDAQPGRLDAFGG